jgi:erythromycin esterase-like protein
MEENTKQGEILWLKERSIVLDSLNYERCLPELEKCSEIVGPVRLVGLGEATHGSKESFLFRQILSRYLIDAKGFNGLIIEMPSAEALLLNNYISGRKGKLKELISNLSYWTLRTKEFMDTVRWMCEYNNASAEKRISLFGCDIGIRNENRKDMNARDRAMADKVKGILEQNKGRYIMWAHNAHVAYLREPYYTSLGGHLKKELDTNIVNFGMVFENGGFNAIDRQGIVQSYNVNPRPNATGYASFFDRTGSHVAVFDIREARTNPLLKIWSQGNTVFETGAFFNPTNEVEYVHTIDLPNKFDAIFWIKSVSPSTLLTKS